ncbi:SET domain-containing protein 4 isoform X2 [Syngnathus scovelli]|uniref:SET domain-containing protein 4 isoform X2 n=1 Tax=Syngnathus scovelli TaxID=161590 RepID=UPI00210FE5FC|nr:SET domain-containing protein 4 isoform X2 [Syngnathus scovelli]
MSGCGRVARKRKKKGGGVDQSVSLSHRPEYVELLRFLHRRGFMSMLLQPALFSDTGRGLQAVRSIKPNQLLISLPESCLLTTSIVLDSYLGHYIKSWKPRPSPLLALCVFLMCERHRGADAEWSPYIHVLPASYTCPVYFANDAVALLPVGLRRQALEQKDVVREMHSSNLDFFRSLQPLLSQPVENVLTFEALRWAWCSVNTRSVYMRQPSHQFLCGQDDYALAPFLDLLNHRPDVQVKAGFNRERKTYEIRSVCGTRRFQQAFINYGSHDNQRLLLEYGFVAPDNPHSVVYVDAEMLHEVMEGDQTSLEQKMKFLTDNNFLKFAFFSLKSLHHVFFLLQMTTIISVGANCLSSHTSSHSSCVLLIHRSDLSVSREGPSWSLMTVLRLMSLPQNQNQQWKAVMRGQAVDEEVERRSVRAAEELCQTLLRDTLTALEKISYLLQQGAPLLLEQLRLVQSLRLEEKHILERCLV